MKTRIYGHGPFLGNTGYNIHTRNFFTALNQYFITKIRNITQGDISKLSSNQKSMLGSLSPNKDSNLLNIVLSETYGSKYINDAYEGAKILYNVWESTKYPTEFFEIAMKYDQFWVPSEWQKDITIKQGYPAHKVFVVPEGVDSIYKPNPDIKRNNDDFIFILIGKWEYRKSTKEIVQCFLNTFSEPNIKLRLLVSNPFSDNTVITNLRSMGVDPNDPRLEIIDYVDDDKYLYLLQTSDVFVSCSRSEGWNLPLCVPAGKLIFSNDNFIPIETIKENDIVISHTGQEQKVLKTFKNKYKGKITKIDLYNDFETLELTPEHPIYGIKRNKFITKKGKFNNIVNIKPEWIKSKDIEKGDIILRTTIPQKYFDDEKFDLLSLDNTLLYDETHVWYKQGYNYKSELIKCNRFVNIQDLSFLFGWYIAEGTDAERKLIFTLNAEKEINIAERIIYDIKKIFGMKGSYTIKKNAIRVVFNSTILCKFFTNCCNKLSYNKKIPEKYLLGPLNKLDELINNMVLGDGGYLISNNSIYYTTVSYLLARQLIFANQRLGKKTSLRLEKRKRITKRPCYTLSWSIHNENNRHSNKSWWHPEGLAILVKNVFTETYNGYVYNCEIENDNSYLLSNATVHNCEAMACGIPSICSNCSGQMEFAKYGAFLVDIVKELPASLNVSDFPGNYYEPDFKHLSKAMRHIYDNYYEYKNNALEVSDIIRKEFSWENAALKAKDVIDNFDFTLIDEVKNTKVLTVATTQTKGLKTLLTSCKQNNINLIQLGADSRWSDFDVKLKELNSYLSEQTNNDIILFVDGYDSYFIDSIKIIVEKFINLNCDILMSSEINCFPDKSLKDKYDKNSSPFKYVNSGGFIGYTQPLKQAISKLLDIQKNSTSEYKNNDQYLWSIYCMDNNIKLDYDCNIFQCLHSTKPDYFELEGARYKNKITNSFPSILHANGNSEDILHGLVKNIYKSQISNVSLYLEDDGPRFNFSYRGISIDTIISIKDKRTNKILHTSNMILDDNVNYFIKANCDIYTIEDVELDIKELTTPLYNKVFNITNNKRCCFITTWFGEFPSWFSYFLKSCETNSKFDFMIFTDQNINFKYPSNVIINSMTMAGFNDLIDAKLNTNFKVELPYKLCDFKAMYGYLYSDYLKRYDYWGFCDLDLVFGNIDKFVSKYIYNNYDIITFGADTTNLHYRVAGPCTLVKNIDPLNNSFFKVPEYEDVLTTQEYTNFEEGHWDRWLKSQSNIRMKIVLNAQGWEKGASIEESIWNNGSLYLPSQHEIALYHFRLKDKEFKDTDKGFRVVTKQLIKTKEINLSVRDAFINPKRTICEVHREMYRKIKGTALEDTMAPLIEEAFVMAKKMNNKLRQYKNNYDDGWWESNKLSGGILHNRKIFIDGGAHFGESLKLFKEKYSDCSEYEIHMFEPHPDFLNDASSIDSNCIIHKKAMWITDGLLDFYKGWDLSGSLMRSKTTGNLDKDNPIKVESVDISSWILNTFNEDDHIVLKLDIEGAEYDVLEKIISTGAIKYIKTLYIEFHQDRIPEVSIDRHNKLLADLNSFGIIPMFWDGERKILEKEPLIYITGGSENYMPLIKTLVESIAEFSKYKIIVYGYDCDIPFDNDKLIKRKISIKDSGFTKSDGRSIAYSMAKESCCLDAIEKNDADNYVWIDGDSFASASIDNILRYSNQIVDYPLINSHIHDTIWDNNNMEKPIGQDLMDSLGIKRKHYPWLHGCLFIFNKSCKKFFESVIKYFNEIDKSQFTVLTDELLFNIMAESEDVFNNMRVHDFDIFKEESFKEFINGDYTQAYKNFTPLLTGALSKHSVLPSTENDIFIFHGQKQPEVLEQMFEDYITKLQNSYFYVPHSSNIVDLKKDDSLLNFTYKEIFENKEYEKEFCHVKPGDVVVDCGANIGIFTRYAYKLGASKVISFEPAPDNYNCLIKNAPNISNNLHNMAVSDTNGHKTLYLDKNAGGHSIIKEDINNTKLGTYVNIPCVNLDSLFANGNVSKIDFLKVDVEGAELEVFEGISDVNLSKVDRIAMEYHHAKFNFDEGIRNTFLDRFQRLGFKYFILYLGDNKHLQMIYVWKSTASENLINSDYIVNYNFVNGPFCELKGDDTSSTYNIDFIDADNDQVVYTSLNMKINHWARASRKWFTNWKIRITNNTDNTVREINYDPKDKKVYIAIDSKSLGDTIAWFPYAEEFRKKWDCKMVVSTFWNDLFKDQYPDIEFIKPGTVVNNLYAMYSIGWYSMQECKNPGNFLDIPMQQTASDILGLEYKVIKPKITIPESSSIEEKYVCIGMHSTCQAKYWNNRDGWQKVVDYLNDAGYKVYSISKEADGYMGNYLPKGVIDKAGDISIVDRIKCLAGAKFFIGIGSGLSWLAWAVGIPVVMISGFSSSITEFPADIRIESGSDCKNCFNRYRLDPSKWLWCPDNNNFECTSSISPEYVIDKIANKFILSDI